MSAQKRSNPTDPWILATFAGCFLFPVGAIWLLVLTPKVTRSIQDKRTVLHAGLGAVTFALVFLFFIWSLTRGAFPHMILITYIGALILGVYELILYGVLALRNRKLRRCLMLVQQEHITSLPLMAEILGLRREKVAALFTKLFSLGFLEGAFLSDDGQELQFKKSVWAKQRVICRSCGAELVVDMGRTLTCAYCGGALQPGFFQHIQHDGTTA